MSNPARALNYLAGRMDNEHQDLWSHLGNAARWWATDACHIIINKWGPKACWEGSPTPESFSSTPHRKPSHECGVTECLTSGDPGGSRWVIPEAVRGEECGWFALQWVWPDASAGDRYIYSLQRLSSPALPWLPLKAIHPHTWIRNEIISLPPRALITQPWWLDGLGHTERAREEIEKRKGLRWWTGTVEAASFRLNWTEIFCCGASVGGEGGNEGLKGKRLGWLTLAALFIFSSDSPI